VATNGLKNRMAPESTHHAPKPDDSRSGSTRVLAYALLALLGIAVPALIAGVKGLPQPKVHDEFAYLLTGDTFAEGRVTNPTHPLAAHFESFHIFHEPSYQAKYPPGQGFFLAIGQVLTGQPIAGVWLSLGLACAAIAWMLAALLPLPWALVGGILPLLSQRLVFSWGDTYWGGAVAVLGGALLLGGALRMLGRVRVGDAVAVGLGLWVLANTRPLEGLVTAILIAAMVAVTTLRPWPDSERWRAILRMWILPLGIMSVLLAGWILYYNQQLTGNALELPHRHWKEWRATDPVHELIRSYEGSNPRSHGFEFERLWLYFLGPFLSLGLLGLFRSPHGRLGALALAAAAVVSIVVVYGSKGWPHYLAPVVPAVYLAVMLGLAGLWNWRTKGHPWGRLLAGGLLGLAFFTGSSEIIGEARKQAYVITKRAERGAWWRRHDVEQVLHNLGGKHLVMVRYVKGHVIHREYVYNAADIDAADIVWARELEDNRALLEYYKDRKVWLLRLRGVPVSFGPYPDGN
jgi:hypothetical protein